MVMELRLHVGVRVEKGGMGFGVWVLVRRLSGSRPALQRQRLAREEALLAVGDFRLLPPSCRRSR